jgi:hypothetical protein
MRIENGMHDQNILNGHTGRKPGARVLIPHGYSYTQVCENIVKCKVVLHFVYVMDGFRRYAHARVQLSSG